VIARLTGALKGAAKGAAEAWFGPGKPLDPVAPTAVEGRAFDFPFAVNVGIKPRGETGENGVDFPTLRRLADPALGGLDLLRLAIETRKDQLAAQRWHIKAIDDGEDGGERAQEIEQLLRKPDGINTFRSWQRMLIEDLLVIDAPCLYRRPGPDGLKVPEVMDGATIVRKLAPNGRTPLPPDPAFQQILKGLPAVDYTLDELIYMPRNLRSNRIYGMSPVEQVLTTVDIALRKQLSQLHYYTEGNVPEALLGVPETWTPDQIKQFQTWWDMLMEGNSAQRRHMKFVPGGMTPYPTRDPTLKDQFDEWLARLICYAFSLSPQALVQAMNRATAQTAQQSAAAEGLEPLKMWFKDLMDDVLLSCFGVDDLQFAWADEEITDPLVKSQVYAALVQAGIYTDDEARDEGYGRDPLSDEQREKANPTPPVPVGPDGKPLPPPVAGAGGKGKGPAASGPTPPATSPKGKKQPPPKKAPPPSEEQAKVDKIVELVAKGFERRMREGSVWSRYP
jgi:hypothetical protein